MSSEEGLPEVHGDAAARTSRGESGKAGLTAAGPPAEAVLVVERLSKQFGERVGRVGGVVQPGGG